MIRFECDYLEGAHPKVLDMMVKTNMNQTPGYGEDTYCEEAKKLIRKACKTEDASVHFLVGGTQANFTVISSILRPHQGVLCADSGHINVHETGAVEATGHKVLALPSVEGKIQANQIRKYYHAHAADASFEHMVQPGMVYISNPTEVGTLYSLEELTEISDVCHTLDLPLFLDGARLGYGLMAEGYDVTLPDIARLCDVFYIGGTKVGAMMGEAVVITAEHLKKDFRYIIKQKGGMFAKGRLLGIQFLALFQDNLYFEAAEKADKLAYQLRDAFKAQGYQMLFESPTNQQFPILPNHVLEKLSEKYSFTFWERVDHNHSAVRICTSWATLEENVNELITDIKSM